MPRSIRAVGNEGNQNKAAPLAQAARLGDRLFVRSTYFRGTVTSNILTMPYAASSAQYVFATAGTTAGVKVYTAGTVATGQFTINALGNIVFFATDAVTAAEVLYTPMCGDTYTEVIPVAASVGTLLSAKAGLVLLSASVTTGVIPGAKTVLARGSASTASSASLSNLGTTVTFNSADVVNGTATVTYLAAPGVGAATADPDAGAATLNF